jgi:hypothetical protein
MSHEAIELDQRVIMALDVYEPAKRQEVLAGIFELIEDPANRHEARGFSASERLYLADMPNGLRVIFRTDEQGQVIEIVDFFRPWRLEGPGAGTTRPNFAR